MGQAWAGSGHTNTVQAQSIQQLGPLQLCPQGHHIQLWGCIWWRWGPRDRPFLAHPWQEAVDKVQLGPSEEVGEGILEGAQVSGDRGDKGSASAGGGRCSLCTCRVSGQVKELGTASVRGVSKGSEQDSSS